MTAIGRELSAWSKVNRYQVTPSKPRQRRLQSSGSVTLTQPLAGGVSASQPDCTASTALNEG
ncbi:hypothetical protein [Bradyrhizobium sp. AC87j1]|uniref:hypothetical protein n=1 Tax=Bradyrhizobium sp. AC87j1 TaxID=2055894 RepID=UPI001374C8FB|nr:hypothetical protein [Bradyrhizobium sp. AC87j1]